MIYALPGETFDAYLDGAPSGLVGTLGVQVLDAEDAVVVARSTAGIIEMGTSSGVYRARVEAPEDEGDYLILWDAGADHASEPLVVSSAGDPAAPDGDELATPADFEARLGRPLTAAETSQVPALVQGATELVAEAAGTTGEAVEAMDPRPAGLKVIVVEVVVRILLNPEGLSSRSEQLGQHQVTKGYRNPNAAIGAAGSGVLALSESERLRARRIVLGRLTGGGRAETIADELAPTPLEGEA